METIFSRRSIRKYTSQPVSEEKVEKLLRAGMAAPTAKNEQPWHFIVINQRELLNRIPEIHPYSQMLREAPVAILVCGDKNLIHKEESRENEGYLVQDCSAVTQNILLAAEEENLGAVWLGVYPVEERMEGITELLKLPKNILPVSLIALGHPAEEKSPIDRYNEERVHYNSWN